MLSPLCVLRISVFCLLALTSLLPTIFNGRVYVGTQTEVDVFGLCTSCPH
jgi:hypothetical protein